MQSRRVGEPLAQLVAREAAAAHLTRVTSTSTSTSTQVTSTSTSYPGHKHKHKHPGH